MFPHLKAASAAVCELAAQLILLPFAASCVMLTSFAPGIQAPRLSAGEVTEPCKLLSDVRLEEPVRAIADEYARRSGNVVSVTVWPSARIEQAVGRLERGWDVVICIANKKGERTPVDHLPGARKVAWKYPSGEPVWVAVLSRQPQATELQQFLGGPTGHRYWSESKSGFTIVGDMSHAEAIEWIANNRVKHTYPMTAARMLGELGGIRDGICIDVGCGTAALDVELAKRSRFTIIGLDIDADMKPLFDKRVRDAGLTDRVRFVTGDAQDMPFADDYADVIVSRGTLTFIPDIALCLKEVDRVLKPTGVGFLGGQYLYTPREDKITTEKLQKIVTDSGVAGAQVIDMRGQWVKNVGPQAPPAARRSAHGPRMLANRVIADYAITKGKCLLICSHDDKLVQSLQQGFVEATELRITAAYRSEDVANEARKRIAKAGLSERIACEVATLDDFPFAEESFDLIAGVGPHLLFGDREQKMRSIYRILRPGGVALIGGQFRGMPKSRRVSSDTLRVSAAKTGISSIQVIDDMGQWIEIRKGIVDRGLRD